ncbi:MAG: hypothetical protein VB109_01480 [Desulfitobacterium hafniense]|uniref:Uncharacterized protein n=1 Tax=Desulfitobacterium hafniense (strain Y51) TaxID=138119 RepID=Q24YS1_DESHY|nr:hypothetical protein [Desulfitobacterium hafniense]MEA5021504.1 hypothetical protein [Desulfitobacterium hafniense]BAE82821.1 hypothetical protein DSY1032 [Desulfitobacterium hafniense Y51]
MDLLQAFSGVIPSGFTKVADHAASGVGKAEKTAWVRRLPPHFSHRSAQTKKTAQGFCFTKEREFKRAETKLREKHAAESGWKQDVSNRPLSRSDLATKAGRGFRPSRHTTETT